MKIDEYKTLEMEQCGWPGSIGDSCAETSRYKHLKMLLGEDSSDVNTTAFFTNYGILRHPTAPYEDDNGDSWREDDTTTDQALPLFLASKDHWRDLVKTTIKNNNYRTGNGDLVSPIFFAFLTNQMWLVSVSTYVQGLLFKLPWRYNEVTKGFEPMKESYADYLNYIHAGVYSGAWSRKLISAAHLKKMVAAYYEKEPNCQFLLDLYYRVIDKYWK